MRRLEDFNTVAYGLRMKKSSQRLGPEDWIKAGFRALVAQGESALKVEPLARSLGTTKGSFYWHFRDLPAFEEALFAYWEDKALHAPIVKVSEEPTALAQLEAMAEIAGRGAGEEHGGKAAEPALRAFARTRPLAQAVVGRVDQARIKWLEEHLKSAGAPSPKEAANIIYAAVIGYDFLPTSENQSAEELRSLINRLLSGPV